MTRYAMRARSQGALYAQRATGRLAGKDVHRRVFAHSVDPEVGFTVRKRLCRRLNGFYCDLRAAYMSHVAGPERAGTHIVLQYPPTPTARAESDGIAPVGLQGLNARDAVVEATGLSPRMPVCGRPFRPDDLDGTGGVR